MKRRKGGARRSAHLPLLRLHCSSLVSNLEPHWPLTCWVKIKNFLKGKARAASTWDGLLLKRFHCGTWGNLSWDGGRPGTWPVWRRREASPCQDNPARMQRVCVWGGGVRLQAVSTPQQQPEHTEGWEHFSLFGVSRQISCLNERHKVGIQTGVMSEIPASCKVHSLVTALLIRLIHLCVKTFRTDGRRCKHANVMSVTCYGAAEGDPVTQPWAECSRTSTGLPQRSKSVVTLTQQLTTHNSQSLAMLPKPVATPPAGGVEKQPCKPQTRRDVHHCSHQLHLQPCWCKVKRCLKRLQFTHKPVRCPVELVNGAFGTKSVVSGTVATKCCALKLGTSLTSHNYTVKASFTFPFQ